MEIRLATADDLDWLVDAWVTLAREQAAYDTHIRAEANRGTVREHLAHAVVSGSALVAVPDDGGDRLGFVSVDLASGRYVQKVARGVVENIWVRPDARDGGAGSELLGAAEELLRSRGADVVALEAMAANDDARRFYRRHGYSPHRVEMEKPLGGDGTEGDSGPSGSERDSTGESK